MLKFKSPSPFLLLGFLGLSLPISITITLSSIEPAYACRPAPGSQQSTLAQRIEKAPIVFQGVVRKVEGNTITIQVNQYFKDNGPAIISLQEFNSHSCSDFIQKTGESYLFFADNKGTQPWNAIYDGAFGSVRPWNQQTQSELKKLGLIGTKPGNTSKCDFDDRKTVGIVKKQIGQIKRITQEVYAIVTEDNRNRFVPCNLPRKFQKDGLLIIFSGNIKEIYPNERVIGTPFKLTKYKVMKNLPKCSVDDRKTVEFIENQVGRFEGNVIITENNRRRFAPCNLPDKYKKDGLKIIFSGEVKEIYPNERWAGIPLKVTKFKVVR